MGSANQTRQVTHLRNEQIKNVLTAHDLVWGEVNDNKCSERLVPLIPCITSPVHLEPHYPINFYKVCFTKEMEDLRREDNFNDVSVNPQKVSLLSYYQKPFKELTIGDHSKLTESVIEDGLSDEFRAKVKERTTLRFSTGDEMFLAVCSNRLCTDCTTHFKFDSQKGMTRAPMIQNNVNFVLHKELKVLDQRNFAKMLDNLSKNENVPCLASFGAANRNSKSMETGDRLFLDDKKDWFDQLPRDTAFTETKRIQGVPVHKAPQVMKASASCQDLHKKNLSSCTSVQGINYLLRADRLGDQREFGFTNANALIMLKLFKNPTAHSDGSVAFFCDNVPKTSSFDLHHVCNLPLSIIAVQNSAGEIYDVLGSVQMQPLTVTEFTSSEGFTLSTSKAAEQVAQQMRQAKKANIQYCKRMGVQKYKDNDYSDQAEGDFRVIRQDVWCFNDQTRMFIDNGLQFDDAKVNGQLQTGVQVTLNFSQPREHLKFSGDQKEPGLDTDKDVYDFMENSVFNQKDYTNHWKQDQKMKAKKNMQEPVEAWLIAKQVPEAERGKYYRLAQAIVNGSDLTYKSKELTDLLDQAKLERIQTFQIVIKDVDPEQVMDKEDLLKDRALLRLLNGEFMRHLQLGNKKTQAALQKLLELKNKPQVTEADFKKLMDDDRNLDLKLTTINQPVVESFYKALQSGGPWKEFTQYAEPTFDDEISIGREPVRPSSALMNMQSLETHEAASLIRCLEKRQHLGEPLRSYFSRKLQDFKADPNGIESFYLRRYSTLTGIQSDKEQIESLLSRCSKWDNEDAVLLLNHDDFDQYLEDLQYDFYSHPVKIKLDEDSMGLFVAEVIRWLFGYLIVNGVKVSVSEFQVLVNTTPMLRNFLKMFTRVDLRDNKGFTNGISQFSAGFKRLLEEDMKPDSSLVKKMTGMTRDQMSKLLIEFCVRKKILTAEDQDNIEIKMKVPRSRPIVKSPVQHERVSSGRASSQARQRVPDDQEEAKNGEFAPGFKNKQQQVCSAKPSDLSSLSSVQSDKGVGKRFNESPKKKPDAKQAPQVMMTPQPKKREQKENPLVNSINKLYTAKQQRKNVAGGTLDVKKSMIVQSSFKNQKTTGPSESGKKITGQVQGARGGQNAQPMVTPTPKGTGQDQATPGAPKKAVSKKQSVVDISSDSQRPDPSPNVRSSLREDVDVDSFLDDSVQSTPNKQSPQQVARNVASAAQIAQPKGQSDGLSSSDGDAVMVDETQGERTGQEGTTNFSNNESTLRERLAREQQRKAEIEAKEKEIELKRREDQKKEQEEAEQRRQERLRNSSLSSNNPVVQNPQPNHLPTEQAIPNNNQQLEAERQQLEEERRQLEAQRVQQQMSFQMIEQMMAQLKQQLNQKPPGQ